MDEDAERTEAPTPRRREEAREQGQVALSQELSSGVVLLAGLVLLAVLAGALGGGLLQTVRTEISLLERADLTAEGAGNLLYRLFQQVFTLAGPIIGLLFVAGIGVGIVQVGFHIVPGLLGFRWERLNPITGWSRVFSMAAVVRGLMSVLKIALFVGLAYFVMRGRAGQLTTLSEGTLAGGVGQTWGLALRLALTLAGGMVLLGVADYLFQWIRLERSLRMSKQELKEEQKHEIGNPEIKARIRKMQREAAKQKMFREVTKATVVITNPTEYAVALRYDRDTMAAPRVVAKGEGEVAIRIKRIARENGVLIVERVLLARALYNSTQIDQEIPANLYVVVAEVLAYVYRLRPPKDAAA